MSSETWAAFVLSLVPAVLILVYLRARARAALEPDPAAAKGETPRELLALLYGGVAALLAWTLFTLLERLFGMDSLGRLDTLPRSVVAIYSIGVIALVEESMKLMASMMAWRRGRGLPPGIRPARAVSLLCAGAAGLGFALYENYSAAVLSGDGLSPRLFTLPFVHLSFALLLGAGLFRSRIARSRAASLLFGALGLVTATLLHGLYDLILLSSGTAQFLVAPLVGLALALAWWGARIRPHARSEDP